MIGFILSLIVGFLLACLSVWTVSCIINRYTKWEKNLCSLLSKRGKKEDPPTLQLSAPESLGSSLPPDGSGETEKKESPAPKYGLIQTFLASRQNRPGSRYPSRRHTTKRGMDRFAMMASNQKEKVT